MNAAKPCPTSVHHVFRLRSAATALAGPAAIALLLCGEAEAKPKKVVSNGCTAEQIQAPSAGPCIDQLEKDVIAGVAYPHALFCDATGVYCCQSDGTRTFGCKKVSAIKVIKTPIANPPTKLKPGP
jgi:hypothetical protein